MEILPSDHKTSVKQLLTETREACSLLESGGFSMDNAPDIRPHLGRVVRGAVLSPAELWQVCRFLESCRKVRRYLAGRVFADNKGLLYSYLDMIYGAPGLHGKLKDSISPEGFVLDTASPLLRDTRRQINHLVRSVKEKLEGYIGNASTRRFLQENLITIRNDRYVIPVRQEYRARVPGIVHDQSASGATLFVEPYKVAELQNKLQEQRRKEEREVERVLRELSALTGDEADTLDQDVHLYGKVDLIMAKAGLALAMGAIEPELTEDCILELRGARHPLLGKEAVPVDIILGAAYQGLIITGPNTGGKTVTMKTAGLLTAMLQSGLFIPVLPGSNVGVFEKIRADIGDEQSLEQSLSTFSGHIKNIISIVEEAGHKTLILLDELGAGTDPSEGAALARAILMELMHKGALIIASTHINELKLFAYLQEGMQNASLEFDIHTLAPTFRLITGVPGSSNALQIAGRLGLPRSIIDKAGFFLSGEHAEMEKMIGSLNEESIRMRDEALAAARARQEAEALREETRIERDKLLQKKKELLGKARDEARSLVKGARRSADESIRELNALISAVREEKKSPGEALQEAGRIKSQLQADKEKIVEEPRESFRPVDPQNLQKGDRVWLINLGREGEVTQFMPGAGEVQVQVGEMRVNTGVKNLGQVAGNKGAKEGGQESTSLKRVYTYQGSSADIGPELHIRGMLMEEAMEAAEVYLDKAVMSGLNTVNIVHGKGTGTLRRGTHELLKNHRCVQEYRLGYPYEGGSGVTIVTLRKAQASEPL